MTKAKVVKLRPVTGGRIATSRVLKCAAEMNMKQVLVVGRDETGKILHFSSDPNTAENLLLLEDFKHMLLTMHWSRAP